ncbi:MAG TPA: tryptophan-rich sensory protein, partial [Tenericutes bacterium]|nr:tryptophan-rich sensory protein [Mycoplasmatota bacterium]
MKNSIKELMICILVPLLIGVIGAMFSNSSDVYKTLIKPSFAPPSIIFPIVWTILYILMGVSSYIIYKSNNIYNDNALKVYIIQLLINGLWSAIFFNLKAYLIAFIWIILLI